MISPDELRRKSFSIAKKGYDRSEVTNYLAQLALQLDTVAHSAPRSAVDASVNRPGAPPSAEIEEMMRSARDAVLASRERAESEYGRLIAAARTRAAEIEAQAVADAGEKAIEAEGIRRQAREVLNLADQERENTRGAAAAEAEELLVAATAEADRMRAEARSEADALLAAARQEAEATATSAHQDAVNVLTSAESEARTLARELIAVERRTSDRLAETRDVIDSLLDRIDRTTDAPGTRASTEPDPEPVWAEPDTPEDPDADTSNNFYDASLDDLYDDSPPEENEEDEDDEAAVDDAEPADADAALVFVVDETSTADADETDEAPTDVVLDGIVADEPSMAEPFPWEISDPALDEPVLVDDYAPASSADKNGHGQPVPPDFAWADDDSEPEGRVEERWAAFESALAEMREARDDIERLGTDES